MTPPPLEAFRAGTSSSECDRSGRYDLAIQVLMRANPHRSRSFAARRLHALLEIDDIGGLATDAVAALSVYHG